MNSSNITPDVRQHLVRVYLMVMACVLVMTLTTGAMIKLGINTTSWPYFTLTAVVAFGCMLWLMLDTQRNDLQRMGILMAMSAGLGAVSASAIDRALKLNPSILVLAFLLTTIIFVCFTASALLATHRSFLFLGGTLSSTLTGLIVVVVTNLHFHSPPLWSAGLYGGLLLSCACVTYETQLTIEQVGKDDKDYLVHALNLFLDFASIFIRILFALFNDCMDRQPPQELAT